MILIKKLDVFVVVYLDDLLIYIEDFKLLHIEVI